MDSELAILWPERPQEINLSKIDSPKPKEQRVKQGDKPVLSSNAMEISKNVFAVVGFGTLIYTALAIAKPEALGGNALRGMEPTEQAYLGQVERYCFNRLPMLNDHQTCRLWAGKYVHLVSGVDPKLDLFGADVKKQLADGFEEQGIHTERSKWESEAEAATVPGKSKTGQ